ncbi:hypothetical protein [Streptomyces sp. NPDC014685]|uniref:hypothetical protein n=1 Tax=Streptomyces sp. NPDC014685 TaxID=3364881 RepID=UPI0036FCC185
MSSRGRPRGRLGVDASAFPRDFAALVRTHRELTRIRLRRPLPLPLDAAEASSALVRSGILWESLS